MIMHSLKTQVCADSTYVVTITLTLTLFNPKSIQIIPIMGFCFIALSYPHTHIRRDKVIAISAPHYVVGTDNHNQQFVQHVLTDIHSNEKSAQRRRKHCALAVVRRTHKQTHTQRERDRQGRLQYTAPQRR